MDDGESMRLIAENLSGERGGETVFSGIGFDLAEGDSLIGDRPERLGQIDAAEGDRRAAAGGGGRQSGSRRRRGMADGGGGLPLSRPPERHEDRAERRRESALLAGLFRRCRIWPSARRWRWSGSAASGICRSDYLSTGQRRRAAIAKLLVSYRPVWLLDEPTAGLDKASEAQFAALMRVHLEDGGIIIAATHLPLGLEGAKTLEMGASALTHPPPCREGRIREAERGHGSIASTPPPPGSLRSPPSPQGGG